MPNPSLIFPRLLMLGILLVSGGCQNVSKEDARRLYELEKAYGDRYAFSFKWEHHLIVVARGGHTPQDGEIEDIYFRFHLDSKTKFRKTDYILLNVYDSSRFFLYKIYFDLSAQRFVKSNREETS